jgi:hypothetical protein
VSLWHPLSHRLVVCEPLEELYMTTMTTM